MFSFIVSSTGDVWADSRGPGAPVGQEGEEGPAPHGSGEAEEGPLKYIQGPDSGTSMIMTADREKNAIHIFSQFDYTWLRFKMYDFCEILHRNKTISSLIAAHC